MLMLIAFSVGNVWAGQVTISPAQALNEGGVSPITVACARGDGTSNPAISSGQLRLYQAASGKTTGNTITFSSESAITSIVFTFANNMTASNGAFSEGSYDSGSSTWTGSATSLTLTVTGTTSSTRIYITNMVVTYADGGKTLSSIAISGTPTKTSYYAGQDFDPAGLTVTGTYSDQSQSTITSGITWSYNPSQELALNQTSIGVTATVGNISSEEENVAITVTEAPAADNYEKVTAAPNDWSGEYLLVYEDGTTAHVWTGVDAANCYAAATISNDVIAKPEGAATLTIAPVEAGGYSLLINGGANDGKYLTDNANNAALKFATAAYGATLSYETDWTKILFSQRCIRFNNGTNSGMRFRYYADNAQQPVQLYKKVEGTVKPAAGLAYADAKHLAKLGEAFTAPTLTNPHSVAVTYESNNTAVAQVAANGDITINGIGVAVITASFDGNDDYKSGSASYTLGVTTHAGTAADPFDVADTKIAIDALETMDNAYVSGKVSQVLTSTLPAEGFISFNISANAAPTGQQIQAYKCKSFNGDAFTAITDVETNATVVVTGKLKKYSSTYELDANCHLVSYEAPTTQKQSIANDQAHPYTVAQAITYAADPATYDLDDFVYVQGVVYDVKSFSSGSMNIFIKDADAENQFELYKCAGINDGNETTAFTGLDDVQSTNIVIAYGQLAVYNNMSELKQGNYLVDLQAPVTAVELDPTAEVEVGSTVTLTAVVMPSNADQSLTWSVVSGSEYASVQDGVVSGIAEGTAVIRAACADVPTLYSECTVTVNPAAAPLTDYYQKVTSTDYIVDGTYLIVYEDGSLAFDGGLDGLDAVGNTIPVTIVGGDKIAVTEATAAATFFFDVTAGTIQAANGKYIGVSTNSNGLKEAEDANTYFNTFAIDAEGNAVITASFDASTMSLRYNKGSNQTRFRYYANAGQQPIALYKLANEVVKLDPGISWDPSSYEMTLSSAITPGDYPEPLLTILADLGANPLESITLSSDNESLATINKTNDGQIKITWVPDVAGIVHFTASYPGNETYKAVTATCTIKVNPEPAPASIDNVVILASFNNKLYAMSNELSSGSFTAIEVEEDGANIVVPSAEAKTAIQWTKDFDGTVATFEDADGKYLAHNGTGTNLMLADEPEVWTLETTAGYFYTLTGRTFFYSDAGVYKNYSVTNLDGDHYSGVPEIRVIDAENIIVTTKVDPELAFTPTSVILTIGDGFVAPTLSYADNFDGLAEVTLESSNPDLATVENNVVSLVADATGTATITASFPGNANYKSGSASYTITVNEAGDDLSGTWTRVTAVAAGQKIIIAGTYNEKTMAMGKQNSNNRAAVLSTLDGDVLTPGATTNVFTLVDAGEGLFAIQASNGKYLNAAGTGSSNYLREADDFEAASAKWTITFDENGANIVATSTGNRNVIRYNSTNNGELFSCYAAGNQRAINIYSTTSAAPVEPGNIVRDNLTAGNYYTICYPQEMSNVQGATLWSFIGKDADFAYLVKEDGPFEAGKPFILFATASTVTADLDEEVVTVAGSNNGLFGTFTSLVQENFDGDDDIYLIIGNALRLVSGQSGNTLPANRAYVNLSEIQGGAPAHMPGRVVRSMPMHKDAATGISNIGASETPVKMLIDGQLFILRGEKMYDAKGQLVK